MLNLKLKNNILINFNCCTLTDQSVLSASACANMDDILIVTAKNSELGILWVNYLRACFDKLTKQRGRLNFK